MAIHYVVGYNAKGRMVQKELWDCNKCKKEMTTKAKKWYYKNSTKPICKRCFSILDKRKGGTNASN